MTEPISSLPDLISLMKWPLIASLILPWLLVYLGLHIVQRGVIFVDLALAQTAAFGTCVAMLVGYDVQHLTESWNKEPISGIRMLRVTLE